MHSKIKLKLENENYRDEKCATQTVRMKRTNENYKSESITNKNYTNEKWEMYTKTKKRMKSM